MQSSIVGEKQACSIKEWSDKEFTEKYMQESWLLKKEQVN